MNQDERLVSVRRVPDETTATLLCDFLKSNGVQATAVAVQVPFLPGLTTMRSYWGHVEVMESDAERARALIEDFYAAEPQMEPGLAGSGNGEDHGDESDWSDSDDDGDDDDEDDVTTGDGERSQ